MTANTLHTLARVRSLALAAMIEAGGRPCWVAAGPSAQISTPPATLPAARPIEAAAVGVLTAGETQRMAGASPRLLAAMGRALSRLSAGPAAGGA